MHGYFYETQHPSLGATRRSCLQSVEGITEKSTVDYICYTLHQQDDKMELAAIIIENKTDMKCYSTINGLLS